MLYVLLIPGFAYLLVFNYVPMFGVIVAFKDFSAVRGVLASPWAGLEHFEALFGSAHFARVFRNSIVISLLRLAWGFPAPIVLAVLLNEVPHAGYKKTIQTIVYLPHFISWVVLIGIIVNLLAADGAVNRLVTMTGGEAIHFLIEPRFFRPIVVVSELWKEAGWGTIIYLASMAGIDPELYQAATVDGAGRFQKIRFVTLPGIAGTAIVLLILRLGDILENGFEQIFLLYNAMTLEVADVFETFAYRTGLLEGRFEFATAVNLFKSGVGLLFILGANALARRFRETALW